MEGYWRLNEGTGTTTYDLSGNGNHGSIYGASWSTGKPADTIPPSAPTGLTAVPGNSQVALTWRKNSESDVTKYCIYGGTSSNPTTRVDSTTSINDTTQTMSGLTNDTTYYFLVTAVDTTGNESENSNEVSATPLNTPPSIFNLLLPENNAMIEINDQTFGDTLTFSWETAFDIDDDSVTYTFTGTGDLTFLNFTGGIHTKAKVSLSDIYSVMDQGSLPQWTDPSEISGTWTIFASDGDDSTEAENGPFNLTIKEIVLSVDGRLMIPEEFALHQNYPNPFNPITTIRYNLPEQSQVTLMIHDILGREIRKLINSTQDAGYKSVIWDGTDEFGESVGTGIYLYQIKAGDFAQTRKMVFLK